MLYNKNQIQKSNSQKILHKIGKKWVVIAVAAFSFLGISGKLNVSGESIDLPTDLPPIPINRSDPRYNNNYNFPPFDAGESNFDGRYSIYQQRRALAFLKNGDWQNRTYLISKNPAGPNQYIFSPSYSKYGGASGYFKTNIDNNYDPNDISKDLDKTWYILQYNHSNGEAYDQHIVEPGSQPVLMKPNTNEYIHPIDFSYEGTSHTKSKGHEYMLILHYNSGYYGGFSSDSFSDFDNSHFTDYLDGKFVTDNLSDYTSIYLDKYLNEDTINKMNRNYTQTTYNTNDKRYLYQITLPNFLDENGNQINDVISLSKANLTASKFRDPKNHNIIRHQPINPNGTQLTRINNKNNIIYQSNDKNVPVIGGNAFIAIKFTINNAKSLPPLTKDEAKEKGLPEDDALDSSKQISHSYLGGFVNNDIQYPTTRPIFEAQNMISPNKFYDDFRKTIIPTLGNNIDYVDPTNNGINAYNSCRTFNKNYGKDTYEPKIDSNPGYYKRFEDAEQIAYSYGYSLAASAAAKGGSNYAHPTNNNYANDINSNYSNTKKIVSDADQLNFDSLNSSGINELNNNINNAYHHGNKLGSNAYSTGYSEATANIKARKGMSYASSADAACAADRSNAALENAQSSAYVHGYSEGEFNPNEYAASGAKTYDNGSCNHGLPDDIKHKFASDSKKLSEASSAYNSGYSKAVSYAASGASNFSADPNSNYDDGISITSGYRSYVSNAYQSGRNIANNGFINGSNTSSVYNNSSYSKSVATSADDHQNCAIAHNSDLITNIQNAYEQGYYSNNGELEITSVPNFNFGLFNNSKNNNSPIATKNNKIDNANNQPVMYMPLVNNNIDADEYRNHHNGANPDDINNTSHMLPNSPKPQFNNDKNDKETYGTVSNPSLLQIVDYSHRPNDWNLSANIDNVENESDPNADNNIDKNNWGINIVPDQGRSQNIPKNNLPIISSNYAITGESSNNVINTKDDDSNGNDGSGRGINNVYYSNKNTQLKVPINVAAGKYDITINWSLSNKINMSEANNGSSASSNSDSSSSNPLNQFSATSYAALGAKAYDNGIYNSSIPNEIKSQAKSNRDVNSAYDSGYSTAASYAANAAYNTDIKVLNDINNYNLKANEGSTKTESSNVSNIPKSFSYQSYVKKAYSSGDDLYNLLSNVGNSANNDASEITDDVPYSDLSSFGSEEVIPNAISTVKSIVDSANNNSNYALSHNMRILDTIGRTYNYGFFEYWFNNNYYEQIYDPSFTISKNIYWPYTESDFNLDEAIKAYHIK